MSPKQLWDMLTELENAIGDLADIIDLSPSKDSYQELYELQTQEKDLLNQIIQTESDNIRIAQAWYKLGLRSKGAYPSEGEAAITAFKAALEYEPENVYIWFNIGECYNDEQKYDEAISAYERVLTLIISGQPCQSFGESVTKSRLDFLESNADYRLQMVRKKKE